MIRDACTKSKGDAVVAFGRHRGKLFREVPVSYLKWAIQEVKERGPEGSSPDLVSLSTYAAHVFQGGPEMEKDPEEDARVPIPADGVSVVSWGEDGWSELSSEARSLNSQVGRTDASKATPKDLTRSSSTKRISATKGRDGGEKDKMNQDVPPEVKAEMEALMTRLAALKDKFGL